MFRQDFMFMKYPRNVWKKTESPKYLRMKHFELSVKKPKNHLDRLLVKLLYLKLNFGLVPETKS